MSNEATLNKALNIFNVAAALNPKTSQYGILTVDTSLGVKESWCFLWFSDAKNLSTFFRKSYPYTCCSIDEDDEEQFDELIELTRTIKTIPPDEGILDELADFSGGSISMIWWGTFNDLCSKKNEIAEKVRSEFRRPSVDQILFSKTELQACSSKDYPIQEYELDMFVDFLNNLKNE